MSNSLFSIKELNDLWKREFIGVKLERLLFDNDKFTEKQIDDYFNNRYHVGVNPGKVNIGDPVRPETIEEYYKRLFYADVLKE